ncbi:ATP-binding protein [Actinoplanes teichomyceticus]|uniref:STAS domain-containing protein n=1 Tax=Actinoplanes teichomyceticus TaxID=1867 RepID=A0A561VM27_ACTTI|nr:ATP-binding protein [Actinoplanes teichomyceticus]TWG12633.1 hypothetical protein FHX34_105500 [Actinoplanes teichomyceticus]GIF14003.1 hypothetical protein Ate01nite_40350 [Actinoplanes teichomyceticus]
MPGISSAVSQVGTRTLVRLSGDLSAATVGEVRAALLTCLVERPDAVIAELTGLQVREPPALGVFSAVARQAAVWPGTPLLLSTSCDQVAEWFASGRYGQVPVLSSTAEALAAEPCDRRPSMADTLLPVSGAAAYARRLAGEACAHWRLGGLTDPARLITGELVTNAAVHAGTMIDLRLSLGRRHLIIAVRDGSGTLPRTRTGFPFDPSALFPDPSACALDPSVFSVDPSAPRGLLLVDQFSRRWGAVPIEGGKVVWAALTRPGGPA